MSDSRARAVSRITSTRDAIRDTGEGRERGGADLWSEARRA
jgi:hypothetical protein